MSMLQATGWLGNLTNEELNQVEKRGILKRYCAKKIIFEKDEVLNRYYYVVDGLIQAYHQNRDGRKWIVGQFSQGDLFPHTGLVGDETIYPASSKTLASSILFVIDRQAARELIHRIPSLGQWITQFLANKNQELISRFSDLVLEPALSQLVSLLKRLARQSGIQVSDGWVLIPNLMAEQDLAAYIGVAPETVSRLFRRLYRRNCAKSAGRGKIYVNFDKLPI